MEHKIHVFVEMIRNGWTWYFAAVFLIIAVVYWFGGKGKR